VQLCCYKITCKADALASCKLTHVSSVTSSMLFRLKLGGVNAEKLIHRHCKARNYRSLCPPCVMDEILMCPESFSCRVKNVFDIRQTVNGFLWEDERRHLLPMLLEAHCCKP